MGVLRCEFQLKLESHTWSNPYLQKKTFLNHYNLYLNIHRQEKKTPIQAPRTNNEAETPDPNKYISIDLRLHSRNSESLSND